MVSRHGRARWSECSPFSSLFSSRTWSAKRADHSAYRPSVPRPRQPSWQPATVSHTPSARLRSRVVHTPNMELHILRVTTMRTGWSRGAARPSWEMDWEGSAACSVAHFSTRRKRGSWQTPVGTSSVGRVSPVQRTGSAQYVRGVGRQPVRTVGLRHLLLQSRSRQWLHHRRSHTSPNTGTWGAQQLSASQETSPRVHPWSPRVALPRLQHTTDFNPPPTPGQTRWIQCDQARARQGHPPRPTMRAGGQTPPSTRTRRIQTHV